jgi:hypothetical protein
LIDAPTNNYWLSQLSLYLQDLVYFGYGYILEDDVLTVYNLGCEPFNTDKQFQLNVGLDFNISCN